MKVYNRVSGDCITMTQADKDRQRIARLRNRVYWGVENVSRETLILGGRIVMVTLTYADGGMWAPGQIGDWSAEWKRVYGRNYVWVAELQKRGAIHYHFMSSMAEGDRWDKKRFDFEWYWGHTFVTDNVKKPQYIGKYLQKGLDNDGKRFPRGARIVGTNDRGKFLTHKENEQRIHSRCPRWVRDIVEEVSDGKSGVVATRDIGGFRIMGKMAYSPYSADALMGAQEVKARMLLTTVDGSVSIGKPPNYGGITLLSGKEM